MKKMLYLLILICMLTGCGNSIKITTEYDSIKLEITNVMNAGCYEMDYDTYFTHNIQDKHIYMLDTIDNLEYVQTDNWVVYNIGGVQFVSGDLGNSFELAEEFSDESFDTNYSQYLIELLNKIESSEKTNVKDDNDTTTFTVEFSDNQEIFELIKIFGTINSSEQLDTLSTTVTVKDENITKIIFDITSIQEEDNMNKCYRVEWNLSNFNSTNIVIPNEIQKEM